MTNNTKYHLGLNMNYRHVIIDDFLSADEITSLSYNHKILVESDTGDLTLYHQDRVSQSIVDKISNAIGKVDVRKSHVYNLTQPYRLHCDSGFDNNAFYTVIVPLDKEPQGGIFVMNQWADHAYSLDNYYKQNDQPVLSFEEQKQKINEFDESQSLPDTIDFEHVKSKRGFTIKEYIGYKYNQAIMIPSKYFHCSQNVKNFTFKKSLAIFTKKDK